MLSSSLALFYNRNMSRCGPDMLSKTHLEVDFDLEEVGISCRNRTAVGAYRSINLFSLKLAMISQAPEDLFNPHLVRYQRL
jgi:hypothetical protein